MKRGEMEMDWPMENGDDDSSKSMVLKKAGEMGMDSIRRARSKIGDLTEPGKRVHMPRSAPVRLEGQERASNTSTSLTRLSPTAPICAVVPE